MTIFINAEQESSKTGRRILVHTFRYGQNVSPLDVGAYVLSVTIVICNFKNNQISLQPANKILSSSTPYNDLN